MELDVPLGKDETVSSEYKFSYSLLLFFLNSNFWLTNKRLIVNAPNIFWVIPTGNDTVTYPLKQIQSVKTKTNFKFGYLFLGVVFLFIGFSSMRFGAGLLPLLLGITSIIAAFQTVIAVMSGGSIVIYSYLPWEAANAKKMINELNRLIADI
ncbi:MAG: hypothetical protein F6K58_28940 [Symploca sp. SIO2E9]|nr:hypothetical protein [Symploca sp. SIO2E9]